MQTRARDSDDRDGIAPRLPLAMAAFAIALLAGCAGAQLVATKEAGRQPLHLSAAERQHLLAGMRAFLESVEGVARGIAAGDMRLAAQSARRSGWSMMDGRAAATALKLPTEFVAVSIDTHQRFDDLAAEAFAGAPKAQLLDRLARILGNCTSCHAGYRLAPQ